VSNTVHYRGTRADVRAKLAQLVAALSTGGEAARGVQLRMGTAALSLIQQAFVVKSRGGMGSDGIKWPPLKRATVAARRPPPQKRRGERPRGLLTMTEDKRWRAIYGQSLAWLRAKGESEGSAKARAAQIAWAKLKQAGAKTRLDTLGGRQVDIGRDTGRLLRSLTPGVEGSPATVPEQVLKTPPGGVIVGTNVPYAAKFHERRRLWPADLPDSWWERIMEAGMRGLVEAAQRGLQQG
jgi:hypothetical protein